MTFFWLPQSRFPAPLRRMSPFPLPGMCQLNGQLLCNGEGLYFTRADMEQVAKAFETAAQEERGSVTLKCADETVYEALYERLLTQQEIFQYLPGDSVSFAASQERLTLTFFV